VHGVFSGDLTRFGEQSGAEAQLASSPELPSV
jgi:hypothetical protein